MELKKVPHWTTFQKAAARLLKSKPVMRLLDNTVGQMMSRKRRVRLAAIDSTGLESHHASRYFIRRRGRSSNLRQTMQYTRYPKHGRPSSKPAKDRYRRWMQTHFDHQRYGQRWQVETVVSMIKRRLGPVTSGRSYWSRRCDLMLMVLTHNIMILWHTEVFYRAG
jgi:hypothetical protein